MKKTLLLLSTILLISIGCNGDNKNNSKSITSTDNKISKIIKETTNIDTLPYPSIEIITSQLLLDTTISNLTESAENIDARYQKQKKQIRSWIKQLKESNIDFSKNNIFIYTFFETSICDHSEKYQFKNEKEIDITFTTKLNGICKDDSGLYYLVYSVEKDIKRVWIKAFKHDYVTIEMK